MSAMLNFSDAVADTLLECKYEQTRRYVVQTATFRQYMHQVVETESAEILLMVMLI